MNSVWFGAVLAGGTALAACDVTVPANSPLAAFMAKPAPSPTAPATARSARGPLEADGKPLHPLDSSPPPPAPAAVTGPGSPPCGADGSLQWQEVAKEDDHLSQIIKSVKPRTISSLSPFDRGTPVEAMLALKKRIVEGRALVAKLAGCPAENGYAPWHTPAQRGEAFEKWASAIERDLDEELQCRASAQCMADRARAIADQIACDICAAIEDRDDARRQMATERANPSGVVDLVALHDLGERIQFATNNIANLKSQYLATVHRAFSGGCPK